MANFIMAALDARYNEVKNIWGCDAAHSLWDELLEFFEGLGTDGVDMDKTPSYYVDNYLINGEFYSIADYTDDEGNFLSDELAEEWEQLKMDAFISNDEYILIQF